ncbi:MAG: hypothetical protein HWN79_16570 [Candidatus Lokiarchaeota archaeon]|nr:hypothetical protein [Candidatus Lokiarchaeota archaeon]
MSIRGKEEGIFRLIGSFLIFVSLILSVFFYFMALDNLYLSLISTLIIIPPFLMSVLLKLEQDFIVKNSLIFLILLIIVVVVLNLVTLPFYSILHIIRFVLIESSDLLLISCWHFSLSLYKKNKLIFIIGGFSNVVLNVLLWLSLKHLFVVSISLILTLIFGLFMIISAELIMKKKGLLNYI